MSLCFMGVLKIDETVLPKDPIMRFADISRELTKIALDYGYGVQIAEWNISRLPYLEGDPIGAVIQKMRERLGGGVTLPFYLFTHPASNVAHEIFNEIPENRDEPERINFFHFLRRIWNIPGVLGGAFLVWDSRPQPELIREYHLFFEDMIKDLHRKEASVSRHDLYVVEK